MFYFDTKLSTPGDFHINTEFRPDLTSIVPHLGHDLKNLWSAITQYLYDLEC
jgi:hypothetical protein